MSGLLLIPNRSRCSNSITNATHPTIYLLKRSSCARARIIITRGRYKETFSNQKIGVLVEIRNTRDNNLVMPLPKGTTQVYRHGSKGSVQFVGEDSIDHMQKDEKVRMRLDEAFNVVRSRKQTEWRKIAYDTYEIASEISLRNNIKDDVVVTVMEPIPGPAHDQRISQLQEVRSFYGGVQHPGAEGSRSKADLTSENALLQDRSR